jgi:methyl-accepting chemotaxis protein
MNPILTYASKLLPTFKRDRIEEDGRIVSTELATNTIPAYQSSVSIFMPRDVKSKEVKRFMDRYNSEMGGSSTKGMVGDVAVRLEKIANVVELIRTAAAKEFETSIVVDGITLYKVSLIKSLELCGFISRFSLRLLHYFYILETSAAKKDEGYASTQISRGEIKELENYFNDFCRALKALSRNDRNFIKDLEELPSVTVGPAAEATLSNIPTVKLDPLNIFQVQGFVSVVYRIQMMVAQSQVSRYKEAKDLKTNLELRKLYLEGLKANGNPDEGIQREIDVVQSRIDRCAELIRKEEEKVGM